MTLYGRTPSLKKPVLALTLTLALCPALTGTARSAENQPAENQPAESQATESQAQQMTVAGYYYDRGDARVLEGYDGFNYLLEGAGLDGYLNKELEVAGAVVTNEKGERVAHVAHVRDLAQAAQ